MAILGSPRWPRCGGGMQAPAWRWCTQRWACCPAWKSSPCAALSGLPAGVEIEAAFPFSRFLPQRSLLNIDLLKASFPALWAQRVGCAGFGGRWGAWLGAAVRPWDRQAGSSCCSSQPGRVHQKWHKTCGYCAGKACPERLL